MINWIIVVSQCKRTLSIVLTFTTILLAVFSAFCNGPDSLKEMVAGQVYGKDYMSILNKAASYAIQDLPLAIAYTEHALEAAKKSGNYKAVYTVHRETGFFYEDNNQLANALSSYQKALASAQSGSDKPLMLTIYTDLAITHRKLGNYKEAKNIHLNSLKLAEIEKDLKMIEYNYHGLGYLYEIIGDYDKALQYYFKSLKYAENRGSAKGVVTTYQNISLTYIKLGQIELGLEAIGKAYQLCLEQNDTMQIAHVLSDYSEVLCELKEFDHALKKIHAALKVYKNLSWKPYIARSLVKIADIYTKKKENKVAHGYFLEALKLEQFISHEDLALLYNKLGQLQLQLGNAEKAEQAFLSSLQLAESHDYKKLIQSNNTQLYQIYKQQAKHQKALEHLSTATTVKDYLINEDKSKRIAEMQFRFDVEKSEREIQLLKLQQNRLLLAGSSLIFAFVLIFLAYIIKLRGKNNRTLLHKNEEIQAQNVKLKESNEVLNQFAYVAAHDLKEPLRNIGSFINLIQKKYGRQFNQEANEYMGFVTDSVKKLNNLLTDLLEYSRISGQEAKKEVSNLNEVLERVLRQMRESIRQKNVLIHYPEQLPSIQIDKNHLAHLLRHLISNAIKFTDQQPQITINAKRVKDKVLISIRDNGIGIDKAFGSKIFNLFHQLDKQHHYDSTGMGLSICKNIVEKYDGNIWFESSNGNGTTFFISMPQSALIISPTTSHHTPANVPTY